jgi:hypothetical protein
LRRYAGFESGKVKLFDGSGSNTCFTDVAGVVEIVDVTQGVKGHVT